MKAVLCYIAFIGLLIPGLLAGVPESVIGLLAFFATWLLVNTLMPPGKGSYLRYDAHRDTYR
jgi:hypothetical protein